MKRIYLDYNASAPLLPHVYEGMLESLKHGGNASSVYQEGRQARAKVEKSREQIANLVRVKPKNVIFTGSATEADNMVMKALPNCKTIIVSAIEHAAILDAGVSEDVKVIVAPVHENGILDLDEFKKCCAQHRPDLVSLILANNETGIIQPVKEAVAIAKTHNALFHTDAVQASGRMTLDFEDLGVDYMSLSSHKMGGPQGVGALIIRSTVPEPKLLQGGAQERRRRAGTENVAGIVGFGLAAENAHTTIATFQDRIAPLRDELETFLTSVEGVTSYGSNCERLANTLYITVDGILPDSLLMNLDLEGVAASSGSACSSGKVNMSHVLMAMGVNPNGKIAGLRLSLGPQTSAAEIARFKEIWQKIYKRLRA